MSDTAICVSNLSKLYHIGMLQQRHDTLRDALTARFRRNPPSNPKSKIQNPKSDELWALRDISFEVKRGEVVGIIGRNGAGKSTLLKILSRITEPTSGRAEIHGRVGALLEVGTGFHPELTGRENVYLNGAILGMRRTEIDRQFDEIVAFAEIEKFLDTPVKRYSSGMYVRLAFAVAAHLEPEILLVDEVLAVGDAEFQRKCLGKMNDVAQGGRTVFLVTHNMVALQSLCRRALWLDQGNVTADGEAYAVASMYVQSSRSSQTGQLWHDVHSAPGNDGIRLRSIRVIAEDGAPLDDVTVETPVNIEIEYWNFMPDVQQGISIHVMDIHGVLIFADRSPSRRLNRGLVKVVYRIPANLLNDGTYRFTIAVTQDDSGWIYGHEDALILTIRDIARTGGWMGKWPGLVRPRLTWQWEEQI